MCICYECDGENCPKKKLEKENERLKVEREGNKISMEVFIKQIKELKKRLEKED